MIVRILFTNKYVRQTMSYCDVIHNNIAHIAHIVIPDGKWFAKKGIFDQGSEITFIYSTHPKPVFLTRPVHPKCAYNGYFNNQEAYTQPKRT